MGACSGHPLFVGGLLSAQNVVERVFRGLDFLFGEDLGAAV